MAEVWEDNKLRQILVSNQLQQHLEINQLLQNLEAGCQKARLGVWLMKPGKGFILGSAPPVKSSLMILNKDGAPSQGPLSCYKGS